MATYLSSAITQPQNPGGTVTVTLAGDPELDIDDIVRFIGYGIYRVVQSLDANRVAEAPSARDYLFSKTGIVDVANPPSVIPKGTPLVDFLDGVTQAPLDYNSTIFLNFKENDYRDLLLSGNITFAAQKHFRAKSITVRMRNLSGTLSRSLSFPGSWIFIGNPGRPSSIAPSRTAILSVTCFGTSDADVIAAYAVQA